MTFLNAWVLFGLIPIYFIYKKHINIQKQTKLLYLSLIFMFLAMARPSYENTYTEQEFNAHDYIIALDASYSMQANDLKPSRYILAKTAIKRLIANHPKDKFTIFAFTSSTLLISPPTTDTAISIMALDALNPAYILTKSTSLKNLFQSIAKLPIKQKNLIIFTDGGDEHNINTLTKLAKRNNIIPYIIATATQKGTALKKDGKYIKNLHKSIVISKINPMLIDLANSTGGKYYQLNSLSDIQSLSYDLQRRETKKEHIKVKTYKEFFYIPLLIALLLYLTGITRITERIFIFFSFLLFIPHTAKADLLDFHYIHKANIAYKEKQYKTAAINFQQISPSTISYYNIASSYYKAGHYKKAIKFYMQIRTKDKYLKEKIFYNLGNCAVKLKKYNQAKKYYINALNLTTDKDALYNLTLLRNLKLKNSKDISELLPKNKNSSVKKSLKKHTNKKAQKNNSSKSSSNRSASTQSNGSGTSKKKQQQKSAILKLKDKQKSTYRFAYKAYEKINKGYTDEKEPW